MSDGAKSEDSMVVVGRNPVREALQDTSQEIEKVLIKQGTGGPAISDIRRRAHERGVPVQFVPANKLDRVSRGANHQGVAAYTASVPYLELHELLQDVAPDIDSVRREKPIILLLDGIQDPYNFGAILRSAVAAGVAGVVIPRQGMAPLSAIAMKASAGTAARIPIARVGNMADVMYQLKERGFWIVGATGEGDETMWDVDWDRGIALIVGSEGKGIGRRIAGECDHLVRIPMRGDAESLNVSVATGVLLFVAARTRPA